MQSSIRKLATVVLIPFFVPTWPQIATFTLAEKDTGRISSLSSQVDRHGEQVMIELDIFSGRPNPAWELRGEKARALLQMLAGNQRSGLRRRPCVAPDLGYRGVVLKIQSQSDWRVFGGCAQWDDKTFDDPARQTETYLLKSMPEQMRRELSDLLPRIDQ
jgi:hypothetical protein